jgi:hypothetical protein
MAEGWRRCRSRFFSAVARFSFGFVPWFRAWQAVVRCSRLLFFLSALARLAWWEASEVAGAERTPFGISSALLGIGVLRPVLLLMSGRGGEGEGQDGGRCGDVPLPLAGRGGEERWRHSLARSATPACRVSGRLEDLERAWCSCSLPRLGDEMEVGFPNLLDWKSGRWCRGVEDVAAALLGQQLKLFNLQFEVVRSSNSTARGPMISAAARPQLHGSSYPASARRLAPILALNVMAGGQPLPVWMREEEVQGTSQADLALLRSLSTEARLAEVICGRQRPLRAVMCSWHHGNLLL